MDLGIFQETKVTDGIYTCGLDGQSVVVLDAPSRDPSGVAVFHRSAPHFAVKAAQKFGSNVVGFQLATGAQRWYILRYYLDPDDTSTIDSVIATLKECPRGVELLVAGDCNANFAEPEGDRRGEDIAAALATEGLKDM